MNEYSTRIAKAAFRLTGVPVTLSPVLDYDKSKCLSGTEAKFRVVLYLGYIDPDDLTITFPEEAIVKVHVKHDAKDINRRNNRTTSRRVICSRDCATYYRMPDGVTRANLTAQWTSDAFLVIQSKERHPMLIHFNGNQLVPVRVCDKLDPRLDLSHLQMIVTALMEEVLDLHKWLRDKHPRRDSEDFLGRTNHQGSSTGTSDATQTEDSNQEETDATSRFEEDGTMTVPEIRTTVPSDEAEESSQSVPSQESTEGLPSQSVQSEESSEYSPLHSVPSEDSREGSSSQSVPSEESKSLREQTDDAEVSRGGSQESEEVDDDDDDKKAKKTRKIITRAAKAAMATTSEEAVKDVDSKSDILAKRHTRSTFKMTMTPQKRGDDRK